MSPRIVIQGPFGPLTLTEEGGQIVRLDWRALPGGTTPLLDEAARQMAAYFDGRLTRFDLPLAFLPGLAGEVQRAMCAIPMGETRTYGDLARVLGAPAQAIGQACGTNPIPILIPCHRILAADGLGGYSGAGGIETKVALLKLEGAGSLLL